MTCMCASTKRPAILWNIRPEHLKVREQQLAYFIKMTLAGKRFGTIVED